MNRRYPRREQGVAAVELAIIYVTMFAIIPFVFLFGIVFMQYNVIKHAAFDAARYVAASGAAKLRADSGTVKENVLAIVEKATVAAGTVQILEVEVNCLPSVTCYDAQTIRVKVAATIADYGFPLFNAPFLDEQYNFVFVIAAEVPNASRLASL